MIGRSARFAERARCLTAVGDEELRFAERARGARTVEGSVVG